MSSEKGLPTKDHPYEIGACYLVETVTKYFTGRLIYVGPHEIALTEAAWIVDTDRYADAMRTGNLSEIEPYPDGCAVTIGRSAIVSATQWLHKLPRDQK